MTTTASRSQGVTIGLSNDDSPETFTDIANITSISGPSLSANDIDVTNLSSDAREYLQGLEDSGEVTLEGHYAQSNSGHQDLRDNVGANVAKNFQITLTEGSPAETIDFSARVMNFSLDFSVDEAVGMSLSLKIDGAVTWSS